MSDQSASGGESALDVILGRLEGQGPRARPIWLPPLDEPPTLDRLLGPLQHSPDRGFGTRRAPLGPGLLAVAGVVDRPAQQSVDTLLIDMSGGAGHLAIVGRPQSGKSTLAATVIGSLALTHTPAEVTFYCLDFGGGVLQALDGLPHVGSVASRRQPELVHRTIAELGALIRRRQDLAELEGAALRPSRSDPGAVPRDGYGEVFLVIDNWKALGDIDEALQDAVLNLAAPPGPARGVRLVVTAAAWPEIRLTVRELFPNPLELSLPDPALSEIARHAAALVPSGRPGRGITSGKLQFLSALPRIDGEPTADGLGDAIRGMARTVREAWSGPVAPPVRVLPDLLPFDALPTDTERGVPIGIEEETLSPVLLDFARDPHFTAVGDRECGKTNLLRVVIQGIMARYRPDEARVIVVDYRRSLLEWAASDHIIGYAASSSAAAGLVQEIHDAMAVRFPPSDLTPEQLRNRSWWSGADLFLVVDDYNLVATPSGNPLGQILELMPQARDIGFHLVLARSMAGAGRAMFDPLIDSLYDMASPALVMSGRREEGPVFGLKPRRLPPGRGRLVARSVGSRLVQTALSEPAVSGGAPGSPGSPG